MADTATPTPPTGSGVNADLTPESPGEGTSTHGRREYSNAEYARFVGRILRAMQRRLADGDIESLPDLVALHEETGASGLMVICGSDHDIEWPDIGNGDLPCCMGAAALGPGNCTCWEAEYDLEQTEIEAVGPPGLRASPCEDCAYRGGSPERQGSDHVMGDATHLEALVVLNRPFFCHQGIRRPLRFRHPRGAVHEPPHLEAAYRPHIHAGVPYRADGTPADLCAGWAAARLRSSA